MEVINGKKKNDIKAKAKAELVEETTSEHVETMKEKLKELQSAKIVVANLEREIADLELQIEQEIDAIGE